MNNLKWVAYFLKSRMNWIFWILFLNLLMLGISLIDYDFPIDSLFYIVSLNLSLTMIFLILTYFKEVKLYKHFDKDKEIEEIKHKDLAETPFQRHTVDYLYRQISAHKEKVVEQQLQLNMHEQTILYEWSRINSMLDTQLYITRLESQRKDMYFDYVSLKRMVIDEIQLTRHISQVKGIGFDVDFKVDDYVYTDTKWCRMIIRQILSNALKYSENFNIEIGTELNDQHVSLYIKDYGRGISKKDMPRIFERGFTSTANRNETTSSGMGLYLVNSVKDQLGIHLQVTSTVGKGTTVRLIFPLQNEIVERMSEVTNLSF